MVKTIMEDFRLDEISWVDRPAQAHAKMTIMKRHDPLAAAIVKSFKKDEDNEAMTFSEVLERNEEQSRKWKAQEALWPIMDAYRESSGKILANTKLSDSEQISMLETSTAEFLSAVRAKFPEVEAELNKLFNADANVGDHISKKENEMADDVKKVADLENQIATLTKSLETSTAQIASLTLQAGMSDVEKAHYSGLDDAGKAEFGKKSAEDRLSIAKAAAAAKAANDEIIKTADGLEVKKSVVGDSMFSIIKSQEARIASQAEDLKKSQEASAMAGFTKRAESEMQHLPGEVTAKAEMLKAVAALPEAVRTTLDTMLKAGDGAMKSAFTSLGKGHGDPKEGSPEAVVEKKAGELMAANAGMTKAQAVAKVYQENPNLYDQQQPQPVAN